eukprot:3096954-Rhodomonas_salina.6
MRGREEATSRVQEVSVQLAQLLAFDFAAHAPKLTETARHEPDPAPLSLPLSLSLAPSVSSSRAGVFGGRGAQDARGGARASKAPPR